MTARQLKSRHFIWRVSASSFLGWTGWLLLIALADLIVPK